MEATALAGRRAGKSPRDIAVVLNGRELVDACWHADSLMRAKVRPQLRQAEARANAGADGGVRW